MASRLSLEQTKCFLQNLATALIPGSRFALWVESTSKRNKFMAVLLPKDYDPSNLYSTATVKWLRISPLYDNTLRINGLDSLLAKSSPNLMIRPERAVELDWLASTFNCSYNEVCQLVIRSIRSKANSAMQNYENKLNTFNVKAISIKHCGDGEVVGETYFCKSIEELYVWADLHAN